MFGGLRKATHDLQKRLQTKVHTLIRMDTRAIPDCAQEEIRAFMTVRNEILRLPRTLNHYRNIGVSRFFITDNGSTDGTREFITVQPDCHVFITRNSYSEARFGLEWQEALLDEYGINHWCLVVDADEWFVYPGYEKRPLPEFAAYLQQSGAEGVFAFLLDMYSSYPIGETISDQQESLLDVCRYFDREYVWNRGFHFFGRTWWRFPMYNVVGGPRWRLLFPNLHRHYNVFKAIWIISDYLRLPLPVALRRGPTLRKIPFVRWLPGTRFPHPHATTPLKLSTVTGVLLHFKFLEDFFTRVVLEINRKEHWDGAIEYYRYQKKLAHSAGFSFVHEGSVAYKGSAQLIELGLMREDDGWRQARIANGAL
jgi:glycosyltransferase involved in cell wall biosynthesis